MQTLQINKATARQLYPKAPPEIKAIFEQTFGIDAMSSIITDRVKSFEDACEILGIEYKSVLRSDVSADEAAYMQLKIIVAVLNEGWVPDWSDNNQKKYYPWFDLSSGSGLSFYDYDYNFSRSAVGSRLCFKSRELAAYAGSQFTAIYQSFMCI
jgi:hypothetical protein